ncbi:hypothetical protein J3R30DRAFT_3373785 [Lentinula aciculospora]|uniref:Uncharacterized protein n=1 Tax=Lentinula aciculospora TaxID=153920 RepID=A0A9W9A9B9_9AGAR|nr:hypothetical protein J3R30DRAFT_3373785 [Lentinula aciculospora]
MANTDQNPSISSESSDQGVKQLESPAIAVQNISEGTNVAHSNSSTASGSVSDTMDSKGSPAISSSNTSHSRPTLVQLGSNNAQSAQPKKYNASDINKKFTEKNSTSSTTAPAFGVNSGRLGVRPTLQPSSSSSHPRLVTTKLTATAQLASSPGPGWSRPSSVTPPVATSSASAPNGTSPLAPTPSQALASVSVPAAPQLPYAAKVIQPQPRSLGLAQTVHRDNNHSAAPSQGKPAWGNVNPAATAAAAASVTRADPRTQSDFPTAAEVAQVTGRSKSKQPKETETETETEVAHKQARMEEADTFRGVHLDPNAHHWDEMEEDDDNFLDGVIEFGDGRQYKIDTNDEPVPSASSPTHTISREPINSTQEHPETVRKEDRFADDFDRSWPRSKNTSNHNSDLVHIPAARATHNISPSTSHSAHSPVEASRVLFNERLNRLEPYNNSRDMGRPSQGSESRSVRNPASATVQVSSNNIRLLQKPAPGEGPHRGRGYNGTNEKQKEHEISRREIPSVSQQQQQQHLPLRSPRAGPGNFPSPSFEREFLPEHRGRRLSNMGPPPVPSHVMNRTSSFRDNGRQLPPHLANGPPSTPTFERRQSSRESRYSARPTSSAGHSSVRHPSQSPVLSHTHAAVASSPIAATASPSVSEPQVSVAELEDLKKDWMQNAAARAKQRRQEEEEAREKEKERARRKAAELEARFTTEKTEKEKAEGETVQKEEKEKVEASSQPPTMSKSQDAKVSAIIQEAVSTVQTKLSPSVAAVNGVSFGKPHLRRLSTSRMPSIPSQDVSRPPFSRKSSSFAPPTPATPSGTAESWRTKSSVQTPQQSFQSPTQSTSTTVERSRTMSFATPPPSALDQVESLTDLEVVDYSDLAKFIGVPEKAEEEQSKGPEPEQLETVPASPSKPRRPIASDFFEEESSQVNVPSNTITQSDVGTWKKDDAARKSTFVLPESEEKLTSDTAAAPPPEYKTESTFPEVVVTLPKQTPLDQVSTSTAPAHTFPNVARRNQYKEAAMSALNDAMSRIKGALDVMHEKDHRLSSELDETSTHLPVATSNRWLPPALREPRPTETFATTYPEPPKSPKAWNVFTVNLPTTSTRRDPVSRKQLVLFNKIQPVRWEILSFIPPVEGMSRREFSLNDVLFRKPYAYGGYKGKLKYPVRIPKNVLKVNIPSQSATARPVVAGAFGKLNGADGASTWRKPTQTTGKADLEPSVGLDTTSRSPPPEPEPVSQVKKGEDASLAPVRSRSEPRMPAGSGVAFYRNVHVQGTEPSVSFFATNELEIPSNTSPEDAQTISVAQDLLPEAVSRTSTQTSPSASSAVKSLPVKSSPATSQYGLPSLIPSSKTESKSSGDSPDRGPLTPPTHHASPWVRSSLGLVVKESPVRIPDPEHLKAVWSQTSNQPGLHPVNSLDGITDDLPTVPFTIQDVKSEDGETPPPTMVAPSRMSLHDVTRAFQQVPSSSSASSHRPTISPPSTTAPVARPTPTYNYHPPPVQPPNQNVRPQYPYHPSPMMSHSPAPNPMYSHPNPIPNRMQVNGQAPLYSPVWMPLQNPNAQNSPMMRPMTASYPSPSMIGPYHPSPGAPQPMYALPPPNIPQQNGTPTRGRTVSMMSPAISHAVPAMPMYPGSPAMMPVHAGRGGGTLVRSDTHPTLQQHPPHHQPQPYAPPPPTGSFTGTRPTW